MRRICFVQPDCSYRKKQTFELLYPPLWSLVLSAHIRQEFQGKFEVSLFDMRVDGMGLPRADIYCFSGMNQDYDSILEAARRLRKDAPNAILLVGGPLTWSFQQDGKLEAFSIFDSVFIGDAEEQLVRFLRRYLAESLVAGKVYPKIHEMQERFPLSSSLPIDVSLMKKYLRYYAGGAVEVSRGCPFLCEFCDVRVYPDNNRSHIKPAERIVEDLQSYHDAGSRFVLLVCDNFIGNHRWAAETCEKIIEWRRRSGSRLSLYTWVTVNLGSQEGLMRKMREAGIDTVFIGIESFHKNSLLETRKYQNSARDLRALIKKIQAFGFIVMPGIIFGFDSDPENIFEIQHEGLLDCGLLTGKMSPLVALPGTPLFDRISAEGRLIEEANSKKSLGFYRYSSNIRFTQDTAVLKGGLVEFFRESNRGENQLARFSRILELVSSSDYIHSATGDIASFGQFLQMARARPRFLIEITRRVFSVVRSPERFWHFARGVRLAFVYGSGPGVNIRYLKAWFYLWTNSLLYNSGLEEKDVYLVGGAAPVKVPEPPEQSNRLRPERAGSVPELGR